MTSESVILKSGKLCVENKVGFQISFGPLQYGVRVHGFLRVWSSCFGVAVNPRQRRRCFPSARLLAVVAANSAVVVERKSIVSAGASCGCGIARGKQRSGFMVALLRSL